MSEVKMETAEKLVSLINQATGDEKNECSVQSYNRGDLMFDWVDIRQMMMAELFARNDSVMERKSKHAVEHIEKATDIFFKAHEMFEVQCKNLTRSEEKIQEAAKKASQNVRKSADDLSSGLARIEKLANFDRLERYVVLLERAASAISVLAEIEKTGKLEKISNALK